ncbi:MAG: cation diffusion facilitator family transporter [Xanthomonadales bacterium]|nr:cation diffusion facilitator family transporter [Xanthomonadales bacterium]
MSACGCDASANELAANKRRRRTLRWVLAINGVMFVGVLGAGIWADSRALIADSADNLGDALTYALSLLVIGQSLRWRAGAALVKGGIQLLFGVLVVMSIIRGLLGAPDPIGAAIIATASVALVANLVCFVLLLKHRDEDVNMRSVWLCSRNDVLANAGVIVAGGLVAWFGSPWPDLVVASLIAAIFLQTAYGVIRDALAAWREGGRAADQGRLTTS